MKETPLYDAFSTDYDRFVNWEARLEYEMPFIAKQLQCVEARRVLDVACGTGQHSLELARRGYEVTGTDISVKMVDQARANTAQVGGDTRFLVAGFGELERTVGHGYDALLCLGNSLPHILTAPDLKAALRDFAAVLRPGGLLFIQNRNFDAVMRDRTRWMAPQAHREGNHEWLFVRFYDFNPDGTINFNILTLRRGDAEDWSQQAEATRLRPLLYAELRDAVTTNGFGDINCYGDMRGAAFVSKESGNLILSARRRDSNNFYSHNRMREMKTPIIPGVSHIVGGVHIAGAQATYRIAELRRAGITHILKLYPFAPYWPNDFTVLDNALPDGEFVPRERLHRGVSFIQEKIDAGQQVVVVCGGGISRSSTFVLAYLLERGYDLRDAWKLVRQKHSRAMPAPQMWKSLLAHYKLPYTFRDVVSWWY